MRTCFYCGRSGELAPCCDHHPDDLVCADRVDCRNFVLRVLNAALTEASAEANVGGLA